LQNGKLKLFFCDSMFIKIRTVLLSKTNDQLYFFIVSILKAYTGNKTVLSIISGSAAVLLGLDSFFSFLILCIIDVTPWMGDQPITRPLPIHGTTQTQKEHTEVNASSGIRTHGLIV
jgi:hypothetical protein